jgi:hypothetical protein
MLGIDKMSLFIKFWWLISIDKSFIGGYFKGFILSKLCDIWAFDLVSKANASMVYIEGGVYYRKNFIFQKCSL